MGRLLVLTLALAGCVEDPLIEPAWEDLGISDLAPGPDLAAADLLPPGCAPTGCRGYADCLVGCGDDAGCAAGCAACAPVEARQRYAAAEACADEVCVTGGDLGAAACAPGDGGAASMDAVGAAPGACAACRLDALARLKGCVSPQRAACQRPGPCAVEVDACLAELP